MLLEGGSCLSIATHSLTHDLVSYPGRLYSTRTCPPTRGIVARAIRGSIELLYKLRSIVEVRDARPSATARTPQLPDFHHLHRVTVLM